jgi:S-adenosylmethionine/arginine decarboxylase-like enzyme
MALHNHLLLNGYMSNPPMDKSAALLWMEKLVEEIGMKVAAGPIASYVTKEGNRGMTVGCLIETSHIAMHVWDETTPSFVQFDLYTCSTLSTETVIRNLVENWGLHDYVHMVLERSEGFNIVSSDSSAIVESEFPQDSLPF